LSALCIVLQGLLQVGRRIGVDVCMLVSNKDMTSVGVWVTVAAGAVRN
jgi:hypothetical protein